MEHIQPKDRKKNQENVFVYVYVCVWEGLHQREGERENEVGYTEKKDIVQKNKLM